MHITASSIKPGIVSKTDVLAPSHLLQPLTRLSDLLQEGKNTLKGVSIRREVAKSSDKRGQLTRLRNMEKENPSWDLCALVQTNARLLYELKHEAAGLMMKRGKIQCRDALEMCLTQGRAEMVGSIEPDHRRLQASFVLTNTAFGPFFFGPTQGLLLATGVILTSSSAA